MSYYNYVDRYGEEKKFYGIVAPLSEDNQLIVFLVMLIIKYISLIGSVIGSILSIKWLAMYPLCATIALTAIICVYFTVIMFSEYYMFSIRIKFKFFRVLVGIILTLLIVAPFSYFSFFEIFNCDRPIISYLFVGYSVLMWFIIPFFGEDINTITHYYREEIGKNYTLGKFVPGIIYSEGKKFTILFYNKSSKSLFLKNIYEYVVVNADEENS